MFSLSPRHVLPVTDEKFHRTTSGKIQRGQFKKDYLDGKHDVAITTLIKQRPVALFEVHWEPRELGAAPAANQLHCHAATCSSRRTPWRAPLPMPRGLSSTPQPKASPRPRS
eukprot:5768530-Prymnesium_polylepis.1